MDESITLAVTKEAAKRSVKAMSRPEGMTRTTWQGVQRVLDVIVSFYPEAIPSELRIAEILDWSSRSVSRWVNVAKDAGLLVVIPNSGAGPKREMGQRTNRYFIPDLFARQNGVSHGAKLACDKNTDSYGVCSEPSAQETSSPDPRLAPPASRPGVQIPTGNPSAPSTVVSMRDWDDERSRQVGAESRPRLPKHPPRRRGDPDAIVSTIDSRQRKTKRAPKPPPQWRRLAEYFAVIWQQAQLESPRLKDIRCLESLNQARTYIEAHFGSKSELEVRQMMNEFVTSVSRGYVTIKPGQSAWMCFTGAWGRQRHVEAGDPYAAYRKEVR